MDNNFSAQVKEIISYSREEALRLGNDFIGTEHLVLGLIRDGENTAIKILKSLNVDLYELRKEIELAVKDKTGKNIANINSLPLTKQAEKVIRITVLEAKANKSPLVESEHLIFLKFDIFNFPFKLQNLFRYIYIFQMHPCTHFIQNIYCFIRKQPIRHVPVA